MTDRSVNRDVLQNAEGTSSMEDLPGDHLLDRDSVVACFWEFFA
jgi:hypothetical protein